MVNFSIHVYRDFLNEIELRDMYANYDPQIAEHLV